MPTVASLSEEDAGISLNLPTEIPVIEDDEADYLAIERHLAGDNNEYALTRVETLSEALTAIERQNFAAVLIDYQLASPLSKTSQ